MNKSENRNSEGKRMGIKHDSGKIRIGLTLGAFPDVIEKIAEVMTFENINDKTPNKYSDENWRGVEMDRYLDAFGRHFISHLKGNLLDKESGAMHIIHACFNLLAYTTKVILNNEEVI